MKKIKLKNVILENKAVGENDQKIKFYKSKELNTRHQAFDSGEGREFYDVECVKIDNFLKDKAIDFVKIDTEGFDYFVLKGMENTIKNNNKIVIVSEFWPYGITRSGVDPDKYLEFLKDVGLNVNFFDLEEAENLKLHKNDKFFIASYCAKR